MTSAFTTLISPADLFSHLEDPQWVIIDCRSELANPQWGVQSYQAGHIPHAVFADLNHDLSSIPSPAQGRHPLPEPAEFSQLCSKWGIDSSKQVVVYDQKGGAFAARLWWLLQVYGHTRVALLDGGFTAWTTLSLPTCSGIETNTPRSFSAKVDPSRYVTTDDVEKIRLDPRFCLIDARSPERFRGEEELVDPVAGHIPGAINRFHALNLRDDGSFLSPAELRTQFLALMGDRPASQVVVYCGSGVTSCHHLVSLSVAGLPGARLYVGSWSEWIRDPSRPIATGN